MTEKQLDKKELINLKHIISKYNPVLVKNPRLDDNVLNVAWNNIPSKQHCKISDKISHPIKDILCKIPDSLSLKSQCEKEIYEAFYAGLEKIPEKIQIKKEDTTSTEIIEVKQTVDRLETALDANEIPSERAKRQIDNPDPQSVLSETADSESRIDSQEIKSYKPQSTKNGITISESKFHEKNNETDKFISNPPSNEVYQELSIKREDKDSELFPPPEDTHQQDTLSTQSPDLIHETIPVPVEDKKTLKEEFIVKIEDFNHYDLKNGKVGQEYFDILDLNKVSHGGKIRDYTIEGLYEIGLKLDTKSGQVTGIPQKQGDPVHNFEFELVVRYETEGGEKESSKIFIKILPDPKTMWKTLEPHKELKDRRLHEYKKQILIKTDGVRKERNIIAASKRGRTHAHKASFRDDYVSIKFLDKIGWSILTVADGAGGAELSRVASEIACETAITNISNKLMSYSDDLSTIIKETISKNDNKDNEIDDNKLRKLLYGIISTTGFEAAKAIHEEAAKRQIKVNKLYTTYLTAIHKEFDFGNFFAGFWVGDGALGVYSKSKEIKLLGIPDEGEYSGETKFITMNEVLTSEELVGRIYYMLTDKFTALFAMSDGVSDPKFETVKNLSDISYWDNLWAELEKDVFQTKDDTDNSLLEWLDFWAEGEHDDRTIAILY